MSRKVILVNVGIEMEDTANPAEAQHILDDYVFLFEGLKSIDEKLKKNDWSTKQVAKKFLKSKTDG